MTVDYLTFTFMKNELALSTAGVAVNFNLPFIGLKLRREGAAET